MTDLSEMTKKPLQQIQWICAEKIWGWEDKVFFFPNVKLITESEVLVWRGRSEKQSAKQIAALIFGPAPHWTPRDAFKQIYT